MDKKNIIEVKKAQMGTLEDQLRQKTLANIAIGLKLMSEEDLIKAGYDKADINEVKAKMNNPEVKNSTSNITTTVDDITSTEKNDLETVNIDKEVKSTVVVEEEPVVVDKVQAKKDEIWRKKVEIIQEARNSGIPREKILESGFITADDLAHVPPIYKKAEPPKVEPDKEKKVGGPGETGGEEIPPMGSVTTLEDKRTPEEKINQARETYTKEYLRCRREVRRELAIDRAHNYLANVFRSKRDKKRINEETYFDPKYKKAKREYEKAREEWSSELLSKKEKELQESGIPAVELEKKLKEYKAKDFVDETFYAERQRLINAKVEGSPIKPALWKQTLDWYIKLPRAKKVLFSTALFGVGGAIGAGTLGAGTLIAGITRFGRGMASGYISTHLTKIVDVVNKRRNEKFRATQQSNEVSLRDQFAAGTITREEFVNKIGELEAKDKGRQRNQTLMKLGLGVISGVGIGMASSHIPGVGGHHGVGEHKDLHGGKAGNHWYDKNTGKPGQQDTILGGRSTEQVSGHGAVHYDIEKGQGSIKGIEELQDKLRIEYGADIQNAPPSVQHFLNSKPDRLAIEYGMFKPGQDAESAVMKLGSTFNMDEQGNLTFHQAGTDVTTLLEKGTDPNVTEMYAGTMIDGDHSGAMHNVASNHNIEEINHKPEVGIDQNVKTDIDLSGAKLLNGHNIPDGIIDPNGATDIDLSGAKLLNAEHLVSTTPAVEHLNPTTVTHDAYTPNGNGTTETTTDATVIKPHDGQYNQGESTGAIRPSGTGAGTQEDMYRQASVKNTGGGNMENVNVKESPTIVDDPRHLENAKEVRQAFGADNVRIDRPDTDTINGVKAEDWNNRVDDVFREHNLKFNSYDQYEQERQLQGLLGQGKDVVEYDPELGQNVDHVKMDYFRDNKELWNIENKMTAQSFMSNFKDAKFIDGSPVPQEDLDKLVVAGVGRDQITNIGGIPSHNYTFANHDQLERLQRMYERLTPKSELVLGNSMPIGNETLEDYIKRLTHKVYGTDDGTLYGFRNGHPDWDNQVNQSINRPVAPVQRTNIYQRGNNIRPISPTRGLWQTSSDYNRRVASQAVDHINNWSTPVSLTR